MQSIALIKAFIAGFLRLILAIFFIQSLVTQLFFSILSYIDLYYVCDFFFFYVLLLGMDIG